MTISMSVKVSGNYEATVKHTVERPNTKVAEEGTETKVGPNSEGWVPFTHGAKNTYEITEEYLGDKPKAAEQPAAE